MITAFKRGIFLVGMLLLTVLILTPSITFSSDISAQIDDLVARRRLAQSYAAAGRLDEALVQAQRNLATARALFGNEHRDVAISLDQVASILRKQGRYVESEGYYQQALQMVSNYRAELPLDVASALQNLAGLYRGMGRYRDAETCYLDALRLCKGVGPEHDQYRYAVSAGNDISANLAMLYREQGRYAEAEPLLKAALDRAQKAAQGDWLSKQMNLSMDQLQLDQALQMINLAGLYIPMKRYAEAETLMVGAVAIQRRLLGDNDPRVAQGMHNLASLYIDTDRPQLAEPLLQQAIETAIQVYGPEHPELATYLDTLATLYRKEGAYQQALLLSRRAVAIDEAALGPAHGGTANLRNNLAVLYLQMENFIEAEKLLRKTLADSEANLGLQHPEVSTKLTNLASALIGQGQDKEAHQLYARALAIEERTRDDLFQLFSEDQKLNYLQERMILVQFYLLHTRLLAGSNPSAVREAFEVWLRWKGIVMESQGRYLEALTKTDNPALQASFDNLASVRQELARLRIMQPTSSAAAQHRQTITALEDRKTGLEAQLSRGSAAYGLASVAGQVDSQSLARMLPKGAAYVDFALVRDLEFRPLTFQGYRYLVFLYRPDKGKIELLDLGPAAELEPIVAAYRAEIKKKAIGDVQHDSQRLGTLAETLYRKVIGPLTPYLQGVSQLIVSPDGVLNLVPFEVFKGPDQRYLVEQYAVHYLPSGRDLVRLANTPRHSGDALVLADPDYDLQLGQKLPRREMVAPLQGVHFDRLPDTRVEADAIVALLRRQKGEKVRRLLGAEASEQALFGKVQPGLLHLATHGFFLQGEGDGAGDGDGANRGIKLVLTGRTESTAPATPIDNPMLRSGIVLAGVNRSLEQGGDEGLITAEKILGLRLLGTDLVTLSACETGVGDVRAGEGVFGLKRAFILAGARTVVLSLWSVPSQETTELMTEFYRQMATGVAKAEALRQAQLAMLRKYPHPFYWGAFQLVGSPD